MKDSVGNGNRARNTEPFELNAEGATRDGGISKVQQQCVAIHPWAPFAGMFKDDADFLEVLEIIAEKRRKMEQDEGPAFD